MMRPADRPGASARAAGGPAARGIDAEGAGRPAAREAGPAYSCPGQACWIMP